MSKSLFCTVVVGALLLQVAAELEIGQVQARFPEARRQICAGPVQGVEHSPLGGGHGVRIVALLPVRLQPGDGMAERLGGRSHQLAGLAAQQPPRFEAADDPGEADAECDRGTVVEDPVVEPHVRSLSRQLVKIGICSLLSIWVALATTRAEMRNHHTTREE